LKGEKQKNRRAKRKLGVVENNVAMQYYNLEGHGN